MKRILGKVKKEIAIKNNIEEYAGKKIVLYDNERKHCEKHMHEFGDKKTFHYIMDNLAYIIEKPAEDFYVKRKNTLEYYKTFDIGVTVRVKVEPGNELKVKTVFTVTKTKIENRRKKENYNKYVLN